MGRVYVFDVKDCRHSISRAPSATDSCPLATAPRIVSPRSVDVVPENSKAVGRSTGLILGQTRSNSAAAA